MNIKTQTIIDYALFRRYFIFKKVRSKTFLSFSLFNLLSFLFLFLSYTFNFINLVNLTFFLFIQLAIISIYIIFNYYRLESTFNYEASKIGQIINYQFSDDGFKVNFEKIRSDGYSFTKYEDLKSIFEFKNYFFIETNKNVIYIVIKGMYDGGNDQDLTNYFKKIIGLNYKKVRI